MDIKRTLPANYRKEDEALFREHLSYALPQTGPIHFHNTLASGMSYLVQGIRLLPESFPDTLESSEWKWEWNAHAKIGTRIRTLLNIWRHRTGKSISEPAIWFTDTWSLSYYFWFIETLPRLCSVESLWRKGNPVFLPERFLDVEFVRDSIERFNIPRLETIPATQSLLFKDLVIPKRTAGIHHTHPTYLTRAAEILRGENPPQPKRKIHISRKKARMRKFVNQEEVDAVFDKFDYETVNMEDLSWNEQAQLMIEARVLASIHGAGLANMVLMQPGSLVLEMRMKGPFNSSYFNMASACKHPYFYMTCEPAHEGVHEQQNDFIIDINELGKTLEQIESY
ncbi:glycosyltransferase family 61 protein [Rubellicoccus peritrichatus]|uniref:Glycosyltransferase family 61 protein n=1 Tax=Rubellicoccus peritrichatus TaxID=3080537 RepID=A0AAQ3L8X8_9BACT|nr:glycosyltransferase family 61 protein [Puniceicoccus sp. CR14]WOO40812.1 glycosyltransferase family 61 protein [Puniceicoccus sp. CR14]